jgi:hypothetical protein
MGKGASDEQEPAKKAKKWRGLTAAYVN